MSETGWRGSRELWLEAAYEGLLDSGVDSVRIMPLAKKLSLSRTSFYWFFRDREELLAALIDRWRSKNTGNLLRQCEAYAETITEAVLNVIDCWLNQELFDAKFEFAVRSWALQSSDVSEEIDRADEERLAGLQGLFIRFGYDELAADVRARAVYLTQIGYITSRTKEDLSVRMKRIPQYVFIFSGHLPDPREIRRFSARHQFSLADQGDTDSG